MIFGKESKQFSDIDFAAQRLRMVEEQIMSHGVRDQSVLDAMRSVPRHFFVSQEQFGEAYDDGPLSIGHGQTISQPYIVASMTEHLELDHTSRVLEIGTGCGYQTAVLAEIVKEVFSIEIVPDLSDRATRTLKLLHYNNAHLKVGDGSYGWPDDAPFDAIIVTAAAPEIPEKLVAQLKVDGRMVLPLERGIGRQELIKVIKTSHGEEQQVLYDVRFVPMVGDINK